jgi:hypothetical protein
MIYLNKKQIIDKNIFILNILYIANISLPMLIFAFFFVNKKYEESINYMLVVSLNTLLAFSLSGNYRQTLVSDNNKNLCNIVIRKRIFLAPIIAILSFFISFFFLEIKNLYLIFLSSFVVITIWITEINLILIEIKKNTKNLIYKVLSNYFVLLLILICFFYLNNKYTLFLIIIYFFLFLVQNFNFNFYKKKKLLKPFNFILKMNYISSIAINFSSFIFRYEINYFLDVKSASFIFFCITVGSSLATITFNSFGPRDFSHTTKLSKRFVFLAFLYLLGCLSVYFLIYKGWIFNDQTNLLKHCLFFSIVGGLIFSISYIFRQNIITNKNYQNAGFLLDIIFSILVVILVPLVHRAGEDLLIYIYFLTSSISLIIYYFYYNYVVRK